MNLGTKVVTRKTGLPGSGIVCAVMTADVYLEITRRAIEDHHVWTKFYPGWLNNEVAIVKFTQPQKTCSLQEIREQNPGCSKSEIMETYSRVPMSALSMYPVEDLEIMES